MAPSSFKLNTGAEIPAVGFGMFSRDFLLFLSIPGLVSVY